MYTMVTSRTGDVLVALRETFPDGRYLQAGGNETVGQGWFAVEFLTGAAVTT
jgi:CRISPR-associated protein Cmr4